MILKLNWKIRLNLKYLRWHFEIYNHYVEVAANAILREALAIARKKATVDGKGNYVATPSITVYRNEDEDITIKAGQFYQKQAGSVYLGVEIEIGDNGRQTVLYPVDTSAIQKQGFTFTRSDT